MSSAGNTGEKLPHGGKTTAGEKPLYSWKTTANNSSAEDFSPDGKTGGKILYVWKTAARNLTATDNLDKHMKIHRQDFKDMCSKHGAHGDSDCS